MQSAHPTGCEVLNHRPNGPADAPNDAVKNRKNNNCAEADRQMSGTLAEWAPRPKS
jgi:hypothetical protein